MGQKRQGGFLQSLISPIFYGSRLVIEDQLARTSSSKPANLSGRSATNAPNRYVFIETALEHQIQRGGD